MIRPILIHPDPVLAEVARPVTSFDDTTAGLIRDLFETMYDAPGRGLAAPQIGVLQRVFVMDAGWKTGTPTPQVFLNPMITATSEAIAVAEEGCLSIPGQPRRVARPAEITLEWCDEHGQPHMGRFTGFEAACIQHEADHLDGRLILDHPAVP